MIKDLRKVYEWLCDAKSKEIFIDRLAFNVTGDFKYIAKIVDNYCEESVNGFSWDDFIASIREEAKDRKIVICGAGQNGTILNEFLKACGIKIEAFCDKNEKLNGNREISVISYETLFNRYKKEKMSVIIATEIYFDEIYNYLLKNGIEKNHIYGGKADITKQYFEKELLNLKDEEFFVDCGALDLETTKNFLEICSEGSAYAFEPDKDNFKKCISIKDKENLKNVKVYNCGCGSKKETLRFLSSKGYSSTVSSNGDTEIKVETIDEVLNDKKVSFMKMDIEGMELEALEGAREIIKSQKPKLAISIYHKPEDLVSIPTFIKELVPEYKFYIRHYSIYQSETVLYAVL